MGGGRGVMLNTCPDTVKNGQRAATMRVTLRFGMRPIDGGRVVSWLPERVSLTSAFMPSKLSGRVSRRLFERFRSASAGNVKSSIVEILFREKST